MYVTREELSKEIILSKKKFRESNYLVTPAECFTTNLTRYLKLMVDRYANKGQWRSYCVDETTEALTKRGWLNIDQITEKDVILSQSEGQPTWSRIKSIYRGEFSGKLFHLTTPGLDALITPGHKFLTTEGLKKVEDLQEKDRVIILGDITEIVKNINFHGGKNPNCRNKPTVDYDGRVWCPETEYGSFVARRNGCVFLTGNSYLDDMKSEALVTLCQNCFKYDETRFDNPFGYLTQIIKYCFITSLEKEEVVRDIKDSLWESIGMTPSYARQIKNEMLREVVDTSNKGLKALKRDVDALQDKIDAIAQLGARVGRLSEPDIDIDFEITELLQVEPFPYTGDLIATLSLYTGTPNYQIEENIEVAGQQVNCISIYDKSTASKTKRVIADTEEATIIIALCSIGIAVRRDLMVKRLREISGYNLTPHYPVGEKTTETAGDGGGDELPADQPKRPPRKKRTI